MAGLIGSLLVVGATACGTSQPDEEGSIETYFTAWSDAWSDGDPYAVIRFYDESVAIFAQPDSTLRQLAGSGGATATGEGRSWLVSWIRAQIWQERQLAEVFMFRDGAAVVTTIDDYSGAAMTLMTIRDSQITLQSMFRWRSGRPSGLPEDATLQWIDELVERHITAWSTGDVGALAEMYTADATIDLHGRPDETTTITDAAALETARLPGATVAELVVGEHVGDAVFVLPWPESPYIVFVVDLERDGCRRSVVVVLQLEAGRIKIEDRAPSLETARSCEPEFLKVHDWWTELAVPPVIEEQVSGQLTLPGEISIDVVNGSAQMNEFFSWGLERFSVAGLDAPAVESVTFAPVPACERYAGVVFENDDGDPNLVICTDEHEACIPSATDCASFRKFSRLSLLHELAHVWLLADVDGDAKERFMALMGSQTWRSDGTTLWSDRGVEQAAEILAWGLLDEPAALGRIGNPSCETLVEGFTVLTGLVPLNHCDATDS